MFPTHGTITAVTAYTIGLGNVTDCTSIASNININS